MTNTTEFHSFSFRSASDAGDGAASLRLLGRCLAAHHPVLGRAAPAQRPVLRAEGEGGAARAELRRRTGARRPHLRAAGQLPAGARSSRRQGVVDRSPEAAVRGGRPARRARPGHRRLQGRQRDRRGACAPAIPATSSASRPSPMPGQTIEDIMHAEAVFLEKVIALHPRGRRQALRHRQLPGRLGGDDGGRDPARNCSARSSSPARRCPTGPGWKARTRCATPAAWPAAAG